MNILILISGEYPGPSAGAKRVSYYKRGLVENDNNTIVDIIGFKSNPKNRFEVAANLFIRPLKVFFRFLLTKGKYDILFIYGFDWFTLILLSIAGKVKGIKLVLEVNEKPGSVYGNFITEWKLVRWVIIRMTHFSYRFMDGFVVISDLLEEFLKKHCSKHAKIIKIPIIVDISRGTEEIKRPHAKFPYLLHTGSLSDRKDGIIEVFEAFVITNQQLKNQLHFYLTSKIATKEDWLKINTIIEKSDSQDYVHFLGDISEEDLLSFQKYCSLTVINKYTNEQNLHNFPTKLGEYFSFGVPVLTTAVGEMGKYLTNEENSYIYKENNVKELAAKMVEVILNEDKSRLIGNNGREIARKNFNYLTEGNRLLLFLQNFNS